MKGVLFMLFAEFQEHADRFIDCLTRVYAIVSEDRNMRTLLVADKQDQERVRDLQVRARAAFRRIERIVDAHARHPTMRRGPADEEIDKFAAALAIYDMGGCSVIPEAIAEMNDVLRKLARETKDRPDLHLERLRPSTKAGPEAASDSLVLFPVFRARTFIQRRNLCFVLMPFTEELGLVYTDHIRKTVHRLGLACERADDIFSARAIIEDIWQRVNEALFLIADATGRNPNVFYEIGIAHTVGKEVILLAQSVSDVPFDLKHLRCIQYSAAGSGMEVLEERLEKTIRAVLLSLGERV